MYLFLVITYDNAIYCGLFFLFSFSFFKGCGRSGELRGELTLFLIDYIAGFYKQRGRHWELSRS